MRFSGVPRPKMPKDQSDDFSWSQLTRVNRPKLDGTSPTREHSVAHDSETNHNPNTIHNPDTPPLRTPEPLEMTVAHKPSVTYEMSDTTETHATTEVTDDTKTHTNTETVSGTLTGAGIETTIQPQDTDKESENSPENSTAETLTTYENFQPKTDADAYWEFDANYDGPITGNMPVTEPTYASDSVNDTDPAVSVDVLGRVNVTAVQVHPTGLEGRGDTTSMGVGGITTVIDIAGEISSTDEMNGMEEEPTLTSFHVVDGQNPDLQKPDFQNGDPENHDPQNEDFEIHDPQNPQPRPDNVVSIHRHRKKGQASEENYRRAIHQLGRGLLAREVSHHEQGLRFAGPVESLGRVGSAGPVESLGRVGPVGPVDPLREWLTSNKTPNITPVRPITVLEGRKKGFVAQPSRRKRGFGSTSGSRGKNSSRSTGYPGTSGSNGTGGSRGESGHGGTSLSQGTTGPRDSRGTHIASNASASKTNPRHSRGGPLRRAGMIALLAIGALLGLPAGLAALSSVDGRGASQPWTATQDAHTELTMYHVNTQRQETMHLNNYILGVLAAQMSPQATMAALRAEAVAIRTYATYAKEKLGPARSYAKEKLGPARSYAKAKGADVTDDPGLDLPYLSTDDLVDKYGANAGYDITRLQSAVIVTDGQILTYHKQPILAFTSAITVGATRNANTVLGQAIPYLQSKPCPDDKLVQSVQYTQLSANQLAKALHLDAATIDPRKFQVSKDQEGYVLSVSYGGQHWTGLVMANLLGLPSPHFTLVDVSQGAAMHSRNGSHSVAQGMATGGSRSAVQGKATGGTSGYTKAASQDESSTMMRKRTPNGSNKQTGANQGTTKMANGANGGTPTASVMSQPNQPGSQNGPVLEVKSEGIGVGLGMSLHEAQAMADKGRSYLSILSYFYPGVSLYKLPRP